MRMVTHSKGKYVAYRSRINAPTKKERAARARVAEAEFREKLVIARRLAEFASDNYPWWEGITEWNGVDGGMNPDGTIQRCL